MELKVGYPSGVPMGGIGTGFIELLTTGKPGTFLINNNYVQPLTDLNGSFFAVRCEFNDGKSVFRLLQKGDMCGFRGVDSVKYSGLFPIAKSAYFTSAIPIRMEVECFSPIIPHDIENSNYPGTVFIFRFINLLEQKIKLNLFLSWENTIGCGGFVSDKPVIISDRTGNYIEGIENEKYRGIVFKTSDKKKAIPNSLGNYALVVPYDGKVNFTSYLWNALNEKAKILEALSNGGQFNNNKRGIEGAIHPAGVIGMEFELLPFERKEIPASFAWYTPFHKVIEKKMGAGDVLKQYAPLYNESQDDLSSGTKHKNIDFGHYYQNRFKSSFEVASSLLENYRELLLKTKDIGVFLKATDLPEWLSSKIINDSTPLTANTVLTKKGILATLEASQGMGGALGTMDQRLIAHAAYQLFYPDINRTELRLFAKIQAEDGHISHFCGNIYENIGSSRVSYGDTTWPDLSCSFIIQCYRDLMNTGNYDFYNEMLPYILKAYKWLKSADDDGDGIPEGGSSWDVEHHGGLFVYTGTMWLAALRVLEKIAELEESREMKDEIGRLFKRTQGNIIKYLWNGEYFDSVYDAKTGAHSDELFPGQLAGEWVVRLLGLKSILPVSMVKKAVKNVYKIICGSGYYRLIPIKTKKDASLVGRNLDEQAWPQYTMVFLDLLAIYLGVYKEGMGDIKRFDEVVCKIVKAPWTTTLWHDCRTGMPCGNSLDRYMNTASSWFILNALTGFHHDEINKSLILGPVLIKDKFICRLPIVSTGYWAYMDTEADGGNIKLKVRFCRIFAEGMELKGLKLRGKCHVYSAASNDGTIDVNWECKDGYTDVYFIKPDKLKIKADDILYIDYRCDETC
ncbi:MAG: GH116 family glycosyl-hydrolase [Clostridiales bacterium]|nr:GH116 family glycosyl-hydrolase [Clostridiales bacterium]